MKTPPSQFPLIEMKSYLPWMSDSNNLKAKIGMVVNNLPTYSISACYTEITTKNALKDNHSKKGVYSNPVLHCLFPNLKMMIITYIVRQL